MRTFTGIAVILFIAATGAAGCQSKVAATDSGAPSTVNTTTVPKSAPPEAQAAIQSSIEQGKAMQQRAMAQGDAMLAGQRKAQEQAAKR